MEMNEKKINMKCLSVSSGLHYKRFFNIIYSILSLFVCLFVFAILSNRKIIVFRLQNMLWELLSVCDQLNVSNTFFV